MCASWLSSWVDGPVRNNLIEFVLGSSTLGSSGFIPVPDRVAAFDNDGTLWAEQPMPVQAPFLLAKLVEQVRADPTLADVEPYRSIVSHDPGLPRLWLTVVVGFRPPRGGGCGGRVRTRPGSVCQAGAVGVDGCRCVRSR